MNERSPKETIKVAGNQKEDATLSQEPWEKALPIPGVPINITEKRETILTSFNQAFESPLHDDQPILPQGRQAKGGLPITKETCHKDGKVLPLSKTKPPFFQKVKQKEEKPAVLETLLVCPRLPNHFE